MRGRFFIMNKMLSFFLTLSLLISGGSIQQIQANTNNNDSEITAPVESPEQNNDNNTDESATPEESEQEERENLEEALKVVLAQLEQVDFSLEELAQGVNEDAIPVMSKSKTIMAIMQMRQIAGSILDESFVEVTPTIIHRLSVVTKLIADHISHALKRGFKELKPFNIEKLQQLPTKQSISLETIHEQIARNVKQLYILEKDTKNAGLQWWNKAYRKFHKYIIKPKVVPRATKLAGLGAVAYYIGYSFNKKFATNWLGESPQYLSSTGDLSNADKLGKLGNFEHSLYHYTRGTFMPTAAATLPFASILGLFSKRLTKYNKSVTKRFKALSNRLKGGIYRTKPIRIAGASKMRREAKVRFKDLVGMENPKAIFDDILKYIEDPERFERAGLSPKKGYLLAGPTRTGKSYFAEALAGEIKNILDRQGKDSKHAFLSISAEDVLECGIDKLVRFAKSNAPCVLFIDEIDLLGLQRAGGNATTLSKFLSSMSGCLERDPDKQVIILAATNKPENLDVALRQNGRFGETIYFEYPTLKERVIYLVKMLQKRSVDIKSFDITQLAKETEGCSFEDLKSMINLAFQRAKIIGLRVNQELIEQALDQEVRKIVLHDNKTVPTQEEHLIAVHQAGHALATELLDSNFNLAKVTIKPVGIQVKEESIWSDYYKEDDDKKQIPVERGKIFTYRGNDTLKVDSYQEKINQCIIECAGHAAEKLIFGSSSYCYHGQDKQRVLKIAKALVLEGLDEEQLPKEVKARMFDKALDLVKKCEEKAIKLLTEHKETLAAISKTLSAAKTLTADDIRSIINFVEKGELPEGITQEDIDKIEQEIKDKTEQESNEQTDNNNQETSDSQE